MVEREHEPGLAGNFDERMIRAHDHGVLPRVAGQCRKTRGRRKRFGCDRQVGLLMQHHIRQAGRAALGQQQMHARKELAELRNHARKHIPRLRVGARNHEAAFVTTRVLVAHLLEVVDFAHDAIDDLGDGVPGLGQPLDALAVPLEDLDTEFVLKLEDRLRDARL